MLRRIQLAIAGAAMIVAALAALGRAWRPEPGLQLIGEDEVILIIDPGSPVWRDGIRPGDLVLELDSSDSIGGWRVKTTDGETIRESFASSAEFIHRGYQPWSLVGLVVALVAALAAYRGAVIGVVAMPLVVAFVADPLFFAGSRPATLVGGIAIFALAGFAPLGALDYLQRRSLLAPWARRVARASVQTGAILAIAWTVVVLLHLEAFDVLDAARWPVAASFAALALALIIDVERVRAYVMRGHGPAFIDLVYGSVLVAAILGAGAILRISPSILLVAGVAGILVYPIWRRPALDAFDQLVTAGVRRETAVRAVEEERGRLARDIHDAPLQDLASAIRALEGLPDATGITSTLRDVAAQLRDVATTLHPPVLQDLGLGAALQDLRLAMQPAEGAVSIALEVDDLTVDGRPPEDVELAAYRVVQEATSNAIRHSGGTTITITGVVASDVVQLEVADDGHGYTRDTVRAAQRAGHFGIDAMRERALAVGARVRGESDDHGTTVMFSWERRA